LVLVVLTACASPAQELGAARENETGKTIYLVSHGWHAGIVIRRADVPVEAWPELADFPDAEYLETGWGDKDYYQTPDPHFGIVLKAGLLPTASVLHIVGFNGAVEEYFPHSEIIRLELAADGFARLIAYIAGSYARDARGTGRRLGPGLYGDSRFYLSHETYHAFNTCNVWTARGLRVAGLDFTPATTLTVARLMKRAGKFGSIVSPAPPAP
jgi:uncharacterized protein (TIGR02117 family)